MDCLQDWPEPVVRVQLLSASGAASIPDRYVKPPSERPGPNTPPPTRAVNIPLIDMGGLGGPREEETMRQILDACEEWGFFQVVNHGVPPALLREVRHVWREFFHLPMELKQEYANTPKTYEGYGSRLGVEKGAILDWGDYFFLHILPQSLKKSHKWPSLPPTCREVIEEYGKQLVRLGSTLLRIFSTNLGLDEGHLQRAFGGDDIGACLRANFYPKCPQPDLTLGLSAHSDPGGLTLLLPDDRVTGLQVRQGDSWITVQPVQDSFIINIADQIQVLSNAKYRSVEHRVIVNSDAERLSLAFFYNPKADLSIAPVPELLSPERPALYPPMTYSEYRLYIRKQGPRGKSQVESLKTATTRPATDTK